MKKIFFLALIGCFIASLAYAQQTTTTATTEKPTATAEKPGVTVSTTETINGVLIDNLCADAQKPENLAAFVKTHTKSCTLMPRCVASGYSIYADGKLMKFDKESNAKIEEFLKKNESKLDVVIVVKKIEGKLNLVTIENQT